MSELNEYTVNLDALIKKVDALKAQQAKLKQEQDDLNKALEEGTIDAEDYKKAVEQLKSSQEELKGVLQKIDETLKANAKDIKKQEEAQKRLNGVTKNFKSFAKEMINGATTAGLAFQRLTENFTNLFSIGTALQQMYNQWHQSATLVNKRIKESNDLLEKQKSLASKAKEETANILAERAELLGDNTKREEALKLAVSNRKKEEEEALKVQQKANAELEKWKKLYDPSNPEHVSKAKSGSRESIFDAGSYWDVRQGNYNKALSEYNKATEKATAAVNARAKAENELAKFQIGIGAQATDKEISAMETALENSKNIVEKKKVERQAYKKLSDAITDFYYSTRDIEVDVPAVVKDLKAGGKSFEQLYMDSVAEGIADATVKGEYNNVKKYYAEWRKISKQIEADTKKSTEKTRAEIKKTLEERKVAEEALQKAVMEAEVEFIEDADERARVTIANNTKLAIKSIDNIYNKLLDEDKVIADDLKKKLLKLQEIKLIQFDRQKIVQSFSAIALDIQKIWRNVMRENMNLLPEETYSSIQTSANEDLQKKTINVLVDEWAEHPEKFVQYLQQVREQISGIYKLQPTKDMDALYEAEMWLNNDHYNRDKEFDLISQTYNERRRLLKLSAEEEKKVEDEIYANALNQSRVNNEQQLAILDATYRERSNKNKEQLENNLITEAEYNAKEVELQEQKEDQRIKIVVTTNETEAELEAKHKENLEMIEENYENRILVILKEEEDAEKDVYTRRLNNATTFANGMNALCTEMSNIYQSAADDETKSDNERAKAQRKANALAIAGTIAQMAATLSNGIASASEVGYPALLFTVPSVVAELLAEFVSINSLINRSRSGYATGGLVGDKLTNDTSDSRTVRVSDGEYIVNSTATKNNLDLLNSINYSSSNGFANQLALAIAHQPAPVVSVETINKVDTRLKKVQTYSHL